MGSKNAWLSSSLSNLEMLTSPTPQFPIPSHSLRCGIMIPTRRWFSRATLPSSALLNLFYFFSIILNQWCSYCHSYFLFRLKLSSRTSAFILWWSCFFGPSFLVDGQPPIYEESKGHVSFSCVVYTTVYHDMALISRSFFMSTKSNNRVLIFFGTLSIAIYYSEFTMKVSDNWYLFKRTSPNLLL